MCVQAWVVFEDVAAATNALRQMQGFPFYDKPMRVAFGKTKSDVVAKRDGTYVKREKRKRPAPPGPKETPAVAASSNGTQLAKKALMESVNTTPSNVLFAQELPDDCTDMMLAILFQQYSGFKEVRMVPGKKGIAFVEFTDEMQAGVALQGLNNFKISPEATMQLSFAKR